MKGDPRTKRLHGFGRDIAHARVGDEVLLTLHRVLAVSDNHVPNTIELVWRQQAILVRFGVVLQGSRLDKAVDLALLLLWLEEGGDAR